MSHPRERSGDVKNLIRASYLLVLALGCLSGDVFASAATVSGTHCKPLSGSTYAFDNTGIRNTGTPGSSTIVVACPIPMDPTALGSTVSFRMRVFDNSFSTGFSCVPYVYSQSGSLVSSGTTKTTGTSQTGAVTLGGSDWTVTVAGNVSTNTYVIQCTMPGNSSIVYTQRVQ
jgi:hypothetical protein